MEHPPTLCPNCHKAALSLSFLGRHMEQQIKAFCNIKVQDDFTVSSVSSQHAHGMFLLISINQWYIGQL